MRESAVTVKATAKAGCGNKERAGGPESSVRESSAKDAWRRRAEREERWGVGVGWGDLLGL